ncbi:MAG: T9SS type A sorting domain-containing protein [Saprospiraceae bacterium]|nr:T9SS type A sorting domain-containing protein [Candidatus Vicinibacter affinis]
MDELTSSCNNNGTADFLSDDYYFVTVYVDYTFGKNWTMHRLKGDPPTGESGYYKVKQGSGDGTIVIGPFFIQEGNWDLIVTIDGCEHILPIVPPDFCGECANFHKTRITNVECEENDPEDPSDDTWSFYLGVYKQGMMTQYSLTHPNTSVTYHNFNMSHPVNAGLISNGCLEYTLNAGPGCMTKFIVCPPRPCSSESECEIEAYIEEYLCREDQTFVQFDVSGGLYLCYQIATIGGALSSPAAFTNPLGHFTQDVIIKFSVCSTAVCTCAVPECFVYVYVPFIEQDCPSLVSNEYETKRDKDNSLIIFPNPLEKQQLRLKSPYPKTEISIYNLSDQLFYQGEFEGQDHSLNLDLKQGVYLVKYRSSTGEQGFIKFIKF